MKTANVTVSGVGGQQRYVPVHSGTGLIVSSASVVAISPLPPAVVEVRGSPCETVAQPDATLIEESFALRMRNKSTALAEL